MLRHLFITAWRDLMRSPLQSLISIGGLAIGLWAAILSGLAIANQTNYDRFFPGHENLYIMTVDSGISGSPSEFGSGTPHDLALHLKQNVGEIADMARIKSGSHALRHGGVEAQETTYDADPGLFGLLHLPVLYGDLGAALAQPESIVIPLGIARKYFGRDNVLGETLEMDRQHPLKITAVIADLPANGTSLKTGIFTTSLSAWSDLNVTSRRFNNSRNGNFSLDVQTLARLKPGTSVEALQKRLAAMSDMLLPRSSAIFARLGIMRFEDMHLSEDFSPGITERLGMFGLVALLILFLSSVNFVNLSTARAARRGVEVGVRKASGANRSSLVVQFLSESVFQAFFALFIAVAAVEWSLSSVNAFLNTGAVFDYWRDPGLLALLLLAATGVGICAGAYPALIMSTFRPAQVLKGRSSASSKTSLVRSLLVTSQFAILVVLMIAAGVVLQQYRFAIQDALRQDSDQALFVRLPETGAPQPDRVSLCSGAFASAVATIPGVRGVACSDNGFIKPTNDWIIKQPGGKTMALHMVGTGPGLLELYGQRIVAGRALRPTDKIIGKPNDNDMKTRTLPINVVLNETAVRKLGFASPQSAIGHALHIGVVAFPAIIVGVVKDFSLWGPEKQIEPMGYDFYMQNFLIHIKLDHHAKPQTLAAIDAAWNRTSATGPIQRTFMTGYLESQNLPLLREGQAFLVSAGVAVLLGCLGLFGLSLSAAARRTKEIGIRKTMGATTPQLVGLLLWQFSRPVLWANLIAWPLAWWAMDRWLSGFAYHVTLSWWLFPAAGAATLAIALLTVGGQAIIVAVQKPVLALRYE